MAPRENKVVLFLLGLASSMQQGFFLFFFPASAALTASLVLFFFSLTLDEARSARKRFLRLSARGVIPPRAEVLDLKASRQRNADWDLCFRFQRLQVSHSFIVVQTLPCRTKLRCIGQDKNEKKIG